MQRLEVSGVVGPIYGSLGVKRLKKLTIREYTHLHHYYYTHENYNY